jgi:hypothetical protein
VHGSIPLARQPRLLEPVATVELFAGFVN